MHRAGCSAPGLFARYFYAPLGAGDRVTVVSAFGGAMVWAGLLSLVARHRRLLLVGTATVLCAAGVARWERVDTWHRAGRDAERIVAGVVAQIPDPDGTGTRPRSGPLPRTSVR